MSGQRGLMVVLVLFVAALMLMLMSQRPNVALGPAPDAEVVLEPGGDGMKLSAMRGHVVILEFWATWCGPCKMSMPDLEKIYQKYKNKSVAVIGVSVDSPAGQGNIPTVVKALGVTYPIMIGSKSPTLLEKYRAESIPTLYVIDKKGDLRKVENGYDRVHGLQELDTLVGQLIEE